VLVSDWSAAVTWSFRFRHGVRGASGISSERRSMFFRAHATISRRSQRVGKDPGIAGLGKER
jgi:hypothetical protein